MRVLLILLLCCAYFLFPSCGRKPTDPDCHHESKRKHLLYDYALTLFAMARLWTPLLGTVTFHILRKKYTSLQEANANEPDYIAVAKELKHQTLTINSQGEVMGNLELLTHMKKEDHYRLIVHGWTDGVNSLHKIDGIGK